MGMVRKVSQADSKRFAHHLNGDVPRFVRRHTEIRSQTCNRQLDLIAGRCAMTACFGLKDLKVQLARPVSGWIKLREMFLFLCRA